jgi:hypothetical protein
VDDRQLFVATTGPGHETDGSAAQLTASEERARTLSLIDFLADYDARRNPPVYDIRKYDLFLLRDQDLPVVPGVLLSPAGSAWLTVDFLDLPARPDVPDEFGAAPRRDRHHQSPGPAIGPHRARRR